MKNNNFKQKKKRKVLSEKRITCNSCPILKAVRKKCENCPDNYCSRCHGKNCSLSIYYSGWIYPSKGQTQLEKFEQVNLGESTK